MTDDIIVRLMALPDGVYGFTSPSPDGYMNIYLNDNLMHEQQEQVLLHELQHIKRNDFYCGLDLMMVEEY